MMNLKQSLLLYSITTYIKIILFRSHIVFHRIFFPRSYFLSFAGPFYGIMTIDYVFRWRSRGFFIACRLERGCHGDAAPFRPPTTPSCIYHSRSTEYVILYRSFSYTHTETRVHGFPFLFSPALSWQLFIPKTFPSEEMSACAHRQRSPRRSPCYNTAFFIIAIIIIIMSRHPHSAPHAHHQFLRYCRSQMRLVASGNLEHGKREYNEKMSSGLTG